jgi:amino acid adenylation domain-containing protein
MIPSFFIPMDAFPLNANKKIDYNALPDPGDLERRDLVAPETAVEKTLTTIWSEVLGIQSISVTDGFLDMGGNSLNAMTLATRVFGEFGVNISLQKMFENPCVRLMADWVGESADEAPAVKPLEKMDHYPLSGAQKRMFLLKEFSGTDDISYNMPKPVRLEGAVDRQRIETALQRLVDRHEALRTSFKMAAGQPVQQIAGRLDVGIFYDEAEESPGLANRYIRPFDLATPPLFRLTLVKTAENRHLLLFDIHHIISDGVTTGVLIGDFLRLYNNEEIPPLKVQYKDYAAWQRERAQSAAMKRQEQYWLERFAQPAAPLELTTDFPRPAVQQATGATLEFDVAEDILTRLEALGRDRNATLFMMLLSCYSALLYRYSGQSDMVVGFPIAGRSHRDLEGIAGIFINTLALRCAPNGEKTFGRLLEEVRDAAFEAYDNQEFQFDDLVERVKVERRLDRNPLLDVMMIMQNIDQQTFELEGLTVAPLEFDSGVSRFDLTLTVLETPNGPRFGFEYAASLFRPRTIRRMAGHLVNIMDAISREEAIKLREIPMLDPEERNELLHTLNDTEIPCPQSDLYRAIISQAEAIPDHVALTAVSGNHPRHLTYAFLSERAAVVAAELQHQGIRPGRIVAVKLSRRPGLLPVLLGIWAAGAAYLPIDPSLPPERIRFMLAESDAALLIDDDEWGTRLPDHPETLPQDPQHLDPNRRAYVMYTSGSTGAPKGVVVNHRNGVNFLNAMKRRLHCAGGSVLALTTISFDISALELFLPLYSRMSIVLANEGQQKDPELLSLLLEREPVKILQITPSRLAAFLGHRRLSSIIAGVPQLVVGGEAFRGETLARLQSIRHGAGQIFNVYGPTETTVWSTIEDVTGAERVTIGRPLDNTTIFILDADQNLLPQGVAGELCIGGLGVAEGYLNRPQLTDERFFLHQQTGARLYRSGDLAKWLPEGNLQFLGRLDFQIKIRGFRIETGEIRHHLMRHPRVGDALVLAAGQDGDPILCAYIVANGPMEPATAELEPSLRRHLSRFVPEYMIPSFFIVMESFPLTPSGKIDRKALPLPGVQKGGDVTAPRGPLEESLHRLWSGVLSPDDNKAAFGVEDNFFALGGHSLKALSLLSQLEELHHVRMPMAELFRHPTIRAMATWIEGAARNEGAGIEAGETLEYYPLSFYQERLWILQDLNPESSAYNMTQVLPLPGGIDAQAVERAFAILMERHHSLRTYFVEVGGRPVQKVARFLTVPVVEAGPSQTVAQAAADTRAPFQLWRPPLVRLSLAKGPDRSYLAATMHHIIADAWSIGILQQEFTHCLKHGTDADLETPPLQYHDFARWHAAKINEPDFKERALGFWLTRLQDGVPILEFPMAARGDLDDTRGTGYRNLLPPEVLTQLEELAVREHTTIAIVLLTVFFITLATLTRQTDLVCALITAGRDHDALKRTVGYFTNSLLMRVTLEEDEEFSGFLHKVGEEMLGIMEYQHFPLELAAQEAGMDMPRPQAVFNMLNVNPQRLDHEEDHEGQTPATGFVAGDVEAKFPVELYVEPSGHGLVLDWVFQHSFFDRDGIQFIGGTFQDVLAQCLERE